MRSGSQNSMSKAVMREGDFRLRRDDRQMFGNFVVLSAGGGSASQPRLRRSAQFVETPVYQEPKLWCLDIQFEALESAPVVPLSPWLPPSSASVVRVTVRQALDRDKQTTEQIFDLQPLTGGANLQSAVPQRFFEGHQIGVKVEVLPGGSLQPLGVQVSLVEVTAIDRDPYRNTVISRFAQSNLSQNFLVPNKHRRQFFVENWGTTPLYVAFSFFAVGPGATAFYTLALPNRGDVYESPRDCWQGYVSGIWEVDGTLATHQALVTEGV